MLRRCAFELQMAGVILGLLTAACASAGDTSSEVEVSAWTEILFIGPDLVPCEGVGPQLCLQVRRGADAEWQLFYDTIHGFEPEPGTSYEIEVRVVPVADAPSDGSSLRYELVRVVSETH